MTFIKAQLCPWCGNGPYKVLAIHTHSAHGVSAAELREMAGVVKTAPICAPEVSEQSRARGRVRGMPESARTAPRRRPVYSAAGRAVQRAKLDAARSPEQREAAAKASRTAALAANRDKHRDILRLFREGKLFKEIEEAVGCSAAMVHRVLDEAGVRADGRSLRWERTSPERRDEQLGRLNSLRSHLQRETEVRRSSLVREFTDAGATYAAVRQFAAERGISVKSMAAQLKEAGADVPDGRLEAVSRFSDADREEMARTYLGGASQSEVARRFGASQAYVSIILRKAGIATRPFRHPNARG